MTSTPIPVLFLTVKTCPKTEAHHGECNQFQVNNNIVGHGTCNTTTGECLCNPIYYGEACECKTLNSNFSKNK